MTDLAVAQDRLSQAIGEAVHTNADFVQVVASVVRGILIDRTGKPESQAELEEEVRDWLQAD